MTKDELIEELGKLAIRFSKGWHEGIKIDVFYIMLFNQIAEALAQPTSSDYALGYSIGFGEGHSAGKALAQPEHDYRTRYDRGCYKCGSHYCPADCPEPLHLVPQQPR